MKGYDFETGGWQSGAGHFTQVLVFIYRQLFLIKWSSKLSLSNHLIKMKPLLSRMGNFN